MPLHVAAARRVVTCSAGSHLRAADRVTTRSALFASVSGLAWFARRRVRGVDAGLRTTMVLIVIAGRITRT